jgi:peptidoglycan hydrolase CwlO-like protein
VENQSAECDDGITTRLLDWVLNTLDGKLDNLVKLIGELKMDQNELAAALAAQQATVDALKAQADKVIAEVQAATAVQLAAIEALRQELANVQVSDAVTAALDSLSASTSSLSASMTALDDINPDAPVA